MVYTSDAAAICRDGWEAPPPQFAEGVERYTPSVVPGARLPHGELHIEGRGAVSTLDLLPAPHEPPQCVVFLCGGGEEAAAWESLLEGLHIEARLVVVTQDGADGAFTPHRPCTVVAHDISAMWQETCGLNKGEAVLVRPDGHVAARPPCDPVAAGVALRTALGA